MSKKNESVTNEEVSVVENVQVAEQTREEKKKLRRAEIENKGALHIDDKYKKPGYRQRLVNAQNVAERMRQGYSPIQYIEGAELGNTIATQRGLGGSVEITVNKSTGDKGIWMEIPEEDALILDEIRDDLAREQNAMIEQIDIPANQRIGKITREE